ncbi:MAG TPA: hypothetical protein VN520_07990 [Streptomyces sp.]|uniref:hypothetical protein n=1 Tax=Streptomyces sp. TaxID=1931 RepID=UPI002C072C72|nr:hypothetical protein [Streptomyces sp.]HWU06312.1 hypothetical protein [Streptomyces sp.]
MTAHASDYTFADSVLLRIRGPRRLLKHFNAEYEEARTAPVLEPDIDVSIAFGGPADRLPGGAEVTGGHKTARWRVILGPPDARPLRAAIRLAGGPPSFALSLVQGYFVEALVAVALAGAERIALPAAAFADDGGATVVLGRSGAGKTTLTARALAAGRTVLSDDQVILDASGRCWRYPRRLRLYPDIEETAPQAWSRLTAGTRSTLHHRALLRRLTRGYVAPSLAVPASDISATVTSDPLPLRRLVVVERYENGEFTARPQPAAWVIGQAEELLAQQRARFAGAVSGAWTDTLDAVLQAERRTVSAALRGVQATSLAVPRAWGARRAVDTLDSYLGLT